MKLEKHIKNFVLKLIPENLKKIVVENTDQYKDQVNGFVQLTYSQQGEDLEIKRLFNGKQEGLYIDVGAFHPIKYSNTYKLYKNGWRGINIEPNPDQIEQFKIHRNYDLNLNIGVSLKASILTYYCFNEPAVNTFVKANADAWSNVEGFKILSKKQIKTDSLANILDKHITPGKKIDLLNIDVEGMDIEVLQSNNWKKYRPCIVLVEEAWINKPSLQDSEIYRFLCSHQYCLINIIGITMVFADKHQSFNTSNG